MSPFNPRVVRAMQRLDRGNYFRNLRKQSGLSLQEVADQLGLSKSKLSLVETGKQDLAPKLQEKLEGILRPDLSEHERKILAEQRRRESEQAQLKALADSMGVKYDPLTASLPFLRSMPEQEKIHAASRKMQSNRYNRLVREYGSVQNYELIEAQTKQIKAQTKKAESQEKQIEMLKMQVRSEIRFSKGLVREIKKLKARLDRIKSRRSRSLDLPKKRIGRRREVE